MRQNRLRLLHDTGDSGVTGKFLSRDPPQMPYKWGGIMHRKEGEPE